MSFHPSILALYASSIVISFAVLYSMFYAIRILRRWDLSSGSELQLALERRTYLISTLLTYVFGFELLSLFLYVFTVDHLHTFFVGAMCAAGSLHVNGFGYPTLILKIVNFLFAGMWLILNYADSRAYDYPLTKKKYFLLLLLGPLIFAEALGQASYFIALNPNIITSCCGTLFSADANGLTSEIASLPAAPMKVAFFLFVGSTAVSGIHFYVKGRGGYVFTGLVVATFVVSLFSIISFISIYAYELPSHHCPFCILQKEYGFIGYPIYLALFGATVSGTGVGLLKAFGKGKSLSAVVPSLQRRLAVASIVFLFIFLAIVIFAIFSSDLVLEGYSIVLPPLA
jgi:hypothetical protein